MMEFEITSCLTIHDHEAKTWFAAYMGKIVNDTVLSALPGPSIEKALELQGDPIWVTGPQIRKQLKPLGGSDTARSFGPCASNFVHSRGLGIGEPSDSFGLAEGSSSPILRVFGSLLLYAE